MRYKKKDLAEIITKGSLKQRLVLWFNNAFSGEEKPLLTKAEETALYESFKSNEEARAFNEWERKRRAFKTLVDYLDQMRRNYRFHMARLTGFTILLNSYEEMESMLNDTLFILGEDKKRDQIIEHLKKKRLSLAKVVDSKDKGFIEIKTVGGKYKGERLEALGNDNGDTDIKADTLLEDILQIEKIHATRTLSYFKAVLQTVREIMTKEGFNSTLHKDLCREYEEEAEEYQGSYTGYSPEFLKDIPTANSKVKKTLEKFDLFPHYEEVKPSEDIYKFTWELYNKNTK